MTEVTRVLIIGTGGHARVVASLLACHPNIRAEGVIDRNSEFLGQAIGPYTLVGDYDDLTEWRDKGVDSVAIAIGDNRERAEWFERAENLGFKILSLQHPTAIVESTSKLGKGVTLCAGSIICADVNIGDGSILNTGAIIDHESRLGAFCHIAPGCRLAGRVTVGDYTFVGIGSTVRDNISIGANTTIGAGSVVVSTIPDNAVAYGVPACVQCND